MAGDGCGCDCWCNQYMQCRYVNILPHIAIMIISILLFKHHDTTFGKIINNETSQWGTNAVQDIRGLYYYSNYTDGVESYGYKNIQGIFSGTDDYCPDSDDLYTDSTSCNHKEDGLSYRSDLVNFNDSYF